MERACNSFASVWVVDKRAAHGFVLSVRAKNHLWHGKWVFLGWHNHRSAYSLLVMPIVVCVRDWFKHLLIFHFIFHVLERINIVAEGVLMLVNHTLDAYNIALDAFIFIEIERTLLRLIVILAWGFDLSQGREHEFMFVRWLGLWRRSNSFNPWFLIHFFKE